MPENFRSLAFRVGAVVVFSVAVSACIPFDPGRVASLTMPKGAYPVTPEYTLVNGVAQGAEQGPNGDYFVYHPVYGRWLSAEKDGMVYRADPEALAAAKDDLKRNSTQPGGVPKKAPPPGGAPVEGGDGGGGGGD
jgi:hypothetical protein